jgi:hypothetical protein
MDENIPRSYFSTLHLPTGQHHYVDIVGTPQYGADEVRTRDFPFQSLTTLSIQPLSSSFIMRNSYKKRKLENLAVKLLAKFIYFILLCIGIKVHNTLTLSGTTRTLH